MYGWMLGWSASEAYKVKKHELEKLKHGNKGKTFTERILKKKLLAA